MNDYHIFVTMVENRGMGIAIVGNGRLCRNQMRLMFSFMENGYMLVVLAALAERVGKRTKQQVVDWKTFSMPIPTSETVKALV